MRTLYALPVLLPLLYFSQPANADWVCAGVYNTINPQECTTAGSQATPDAFIAAFAQAAFQHRTNSARENYRAGTCTIDDDSARCEYSWDVYGTTSTDFVGLVKNETPSCPSTLEVSGPNSSVISTGGKSYVAWSVSQVVSDICHNSCSYMASSAARSDCHLVKGSTDTGFCNFFVGHNTASPSCSSESGYAAPRTGDPLGGTTSPGGDGDDGGDDGSGDGGDDGGNTGGGNTGGSDGSDFDGELDFDNPGQLDAKSVIDDERNGLAYERFTLDMQETWNDSEFGKALAEFQQSLNSTSGQGECPRPVIQLGFTTVVLESHCDLLFTPQVLGIFTTIFLAMWSLLAVRIVLSA